MINSPVRLLARSAWIAAWFSERKASLESHRLRAGFCHSPQITPFSYLVLKPIFCAPASVPPQQWTGRTVVSEPINRGHAAVGPVGQLKEYDIRT
jgi:hypothetical protein